MPVFAVSPVPSQVAKSITQAALIQNLGDANVYLDTDSSVSIASYGIVLAPRSSINWQSDTTLWAATAIGNVSELSIMYGADSAALGEVSVIGTVNIDGDVHLDGPVQIDGPVTVEGTVDIGNVVQTTVTNQVETTVVGTVDTVVSGPVSISGTVPVEGDVNVTGPVTVTNTVAIDGTVNVDLPVKVQGGGDVIYDQLHFVEPNIPTAIEIFNENPDGLTYYGLRITLSLLFNNIPDNSLGAVIVVGGGGTTPYEWGTVLASPQGTEKVGQLGRPETHSFTVPMTSSYPYRLLISNVQAQDRLVQVTVSGVQVAPTYPETDFTQNLQIPFASTISFVPGARLFLPPSFQPYQIRIYNGANASLNQLNLYMVTADAGYTAIASNVQVWQPGQVSPMGASSSSIFTVPGTGTAAILASSANNTGAAHLTLLA